MKLSYNNLKQFLNKDRLFKCIQFLLLTITIILFIQIDFLKNFYILDINKMIRYSDKKIILSSVYQQFKSFGIDYEYILYTIIFSIFTFIPIGIVLEMCTKSDRKNFKIKIICIYFILKFISSNFVAVDTLIFNIIGILIGIFLNRNVKNKKELIFIIIIILFYIISFKPITELFIFDLTYSDSKKFYSEDSLLTKNREINSQLSGLYEPYIEFKHDLKDNKYVEGIFEGFEIYDHNIKIKISGKVMNFILNDNITIIDKQTLDYNSNEIFLHYGLNELLKNNLPLNKRIRTKERMFELINSKSRVTLTLDNTNNIKYICISSYEYRK